MRRDKPSSKQLSPTTWDERPRAYHRETFIAICRKLLQGEDLKTICARPPMPIGPVFLSWVQDHQEAREIYRSVRNFESDRMLAKELDLPWTVPPQEWEEQVRANLQRGWPVDFIDRKYIPPDWAKVYPLIGAPPVWSTESRGAYDHLINDFTQMLEPRDLMELILVKEAADSTWEEARGAREKSALPERRYQQRLQVEAQLQQAKRAPQATVEATLAKPATALDYSRIFEAGFTYYQGLDAAQSRAIKRRDNALRQIERWRNGLGGKARDLSDKFIAEQALAERYGAAQLADEYTEVIASDVGAPLPPSGEAAVETAPATASVLDEPSGAERLISTAGATPEALSPRASAGEECWDDE